MYFWIKKDVYIIILRIFEFFLNEVNISFENCTEVYIIHNFPNLPLGGKGGIQNIP